MLAPGRELFLERDSLLADFPPLGVAGGSSCWGPCRLPASLSLWKKGVCGISPNHKARPANDLNFRVGRGVLPSPEGTLPTPFLQ